MKTTTTTTLFTLPSATLPAIPTCVSAQRQLWISFLADAFGCDAGRLRLIQTREGRPAGFNGMLMMPSHLTHAHLFEHLGSKGITIKCEMGVNLDQIIGIQARVSEGKSYAVRVRRSLEPAVTFHETCASDLEAQGAAIMTLRERLLLGAFYLHVIGKHLDQVTPTLCAGTRFRNDRVPHIRWNLALNRLDIGWCTFIDRKSGARAREVWQ